MKPVVEEPAASRSKSPEVKESFGQAVVSTVYAVFGASGKIQQDKGNVARPVLEDAEPQEAEGESSSGEDSNLLSGLAPSEASDAESEAGSPSGSPAPEASEEQCDDSHDEERSPRMNYKPMKIRKEPQESEEQFDDSHDEERSPRMPYKPKLQKKKVQKEQALAVTEPKVSEIQRQALLEFFSPSLDGGEVFLITDSAHRRRFMQQLFN